MLKECYLCVQEPHFQLRPVMAVAKSLGSISSYKCDFGQTSIFS